MRREDLRSHALAFPDDPEEDVLGPDVVVTQLERFPQRELQHLLRPRGERDVTLWHDLAADLTDDAHDIHAEDLDGQARLHQHLGTHAVALGGEPEEQVLGADVVVPERAGLLLGEHDDDAGPVGETFEHADLLAPLDGAIRADERRLGFVARRDRVEALGARIAALERAKQPPTLPPELLTLSSLRGNGMPKGRPRMLRELGATPLGVVRGRDASYR